MSYEKDVNTVYKALEEGITSEEDFEAFERIQDENDRLQAENKRLHAAAEWMVAAVFDVAGNLATYIDVAGNLATYAMHREEIAAAAKNLTEALDAYPTQEEETP